MAENSSEDNWHEDQPARELNISVQLIDGSYFVASPDSDDYARLDRNEIRWLEGLVARQDGVSAADLLTPEDEPDIPLLLEYRQARDSLREKINRLFGDDVVQSTHVVDRELLHVAPGCRLRWWQFFGLKDEQTNLLYGHPSTFLHLATNGLLETLGYRPSEVPVPPEDYLGASSRVLRSMHHNPPSDSRHFAPVYTSQNPLLSAVAYWKLKEIFPGAEQSDVDWMTQAECTHADPTDFASRYKRQTDQARAYCDGCQVSKACGAFAVRNNITKGVWGGMDNKERLNTEFTASVERVRAHIEASSDEPPATRRHRLALETASWLRPYIENRERSALKKAQLPAMEAIVAHFESGFENPDGFVTMPTGTGKTVLFIEFIRAVGLRTVVLVPTQQLVHQTVSAFENFHEEGEVGMIYADAKQLGRYITVTTYQSFVRHVTKGTGLFSLETIELLVLDEGHRTLSSRNRELLTALDHVPKIGFTATDEYDPSKRLRDILPREIYRMAITEAIDAGLIAPYQTIFVDTETDMSDVRISSSTRDYDEKTLAEAVDVADRNRLAADIYRRHFSGRKAVFFCASIKHAQSVAARLRELGIRAEAVYGDQTKTEKARALEALKTPLDQGGLEVVCSARLLTEGWDNPEVSVCFNLTPTLSRVMAQQKSGRTLRIDPSNPDKVAAIVEFIDRDYKRPPVTFPDPDVAEKAVYFPEGDIPQSRLVILEEAGITTDHAEIERRVYEMNTERRRLAGLPPHDWPLLPDVINSALEAAGIKKKSSADALRSLFLEPGANVLSMPIFTEVLKEFPQEFRVISERGSQHPQYAFSPRFAEKLTAELTGFFERSNNGSTLNLITSALGSQGR